MSVNGDEGAGADGPPVERAGGGEADVEVLGTVAAAVAVVLLAFAGVLAKYEVMLRVAGWGGIARCR